MRHVDKEHLGLIDVARSWSYEKCRKDEKWLPRRIGAIVCAFARLFLLMKMKSMLSFAESRWYCIIHSMISIEI
jgi:hypothetical protein